MCAAIPGDLLSVAGHMTLLAKRNLIFDLSIKTKMNFCRTSHCQRYCCFGYPSHRKKIDNHLSIRIFILLHSVKKINNCILRNELNDSLNSMKTALQHSISSFFSSPDVITLVTFIKVSTHTQQCWSTGGISVSKRWRVSYKVSIKHSVMLLLHLSFTSLW